MSADKFKSGWERLVAQILSKKGIGFQYEPKSFHLNGRIRYTPDFVLGLQQNGKKIVVEPHGIMKPSDSQKFSMFRRIYGKDHFLILLVRNDVIPSVPEEAYDDIWPIEYADLLFDRLSVSTT